jgi:hypothetical protein
MYGSYNATTILNNCDSYVYLGGMDLKTAQDISLRLNIPLEEVLYMPVGKEYVFRRGMRPIATMRYDVRKHPIYIKTEGDKTDRLGKEGGDQREDRSNIDHIYKEDHIDSEGYGKNEDHIDKGGSTVRKERGHKEMNKVVSKNMDIIKGEPMGMATEKTGRSLNGKHMFFVQSMKSSMFGTNLSVKEIVGKRNAVEKSGRAAEKTGRIISPHGETGHNFVGNRNVEDNAIGDNDAGDNEIEDGKSVGDNKIDDETKEIQIMELDEGILMRMKKHMAEFFGGGDT